jgi:8-amino-7-oxononanoate synthase
MPRALDFTSSLYLGIRHPSRSLRPWSHFTTGKPAALESPPSAEAVAKALAELQGCERVTLLPSTLHLFVDLFELLRHEGVRLYIDAGAYPIARQGAELAAARGALLRQIPHYDPVAARRIIEADSGSSLRPVILADGFCADCGRSAPLPDYLHCAIQQNGYVVLDDTQALGIWGRAPDQVNPYGRGGGGTLHLHNIRCPAVIVGSSLAKGFGVPLAMLGGSAKVVRQFIRRSESRVHASPPSIAVLHAALHALRVNAERGDAIRRHLADLVTCFRGKIHRIGFCGTRSLFPAQAVFTYPRWDPVRLHRSLGAAGVRTIVVRERAAPGTKLLFVLNALHSIDDVDQAANALAAAADGRFARPRANPSTHYPWSASRVQVLDEIDPSRDCDHPDARGTGGA